MSTTYNRMDVVLVKSDFRDDWRLGIVDKDFVPDDIWVRATVKEGPSATSLRCPVYDPQEVRLATEADLAEVTAAFEFVDGLCTLEIECIASTQKANLDLPPFDTCSLNEALREDPEEAQEFALHVEERKIEATTPLSGPYETHDPEIVFWV